MVLSLPKEKKEKSGDYDQNSNFKALAIQQVSP